MAAELKFSGVNKKVALSIPVEILNWIDEYQHRKEHKSRADAIRCLIVTSLDQHRLLDTMGRVKALKNLEDEMKSD